MVGPLCLRVTFMPGAVSAIRFVYISPTADHLRCGDSRLPASGPTSGQVGCGSGSGPGLAGVRSAAGAVLGTAGSWQRVVGSAHRAAARGDICMWLGRGDRQLQATRSDEAGGYVAGVVGRDGGGAYTEEQQQALK